MKSQYYLIQSSNCASEIKGHSSIAFRKSQLRVAAAQDNERNYSHAMSVCEDLLFLVENKVVNKELHLLDDGEMKARQFCKDFLKYANSKKRGNMLYI